MKYEDRHIDKREISGRAIADGFFTEEEAKHYFGLCKPDHSDCTYPLCGIRKKDKGDA